MTALQDHPPTDPEVLIEEARRRQRRRRRAIVAVVVALGAGALAVVGIWGGGPPPKVPPAPHGGRSAGASAPALQNLTGSLGYIGPGAQITTVIRWHGEVLAAGAGPVPRSFPCWPLGCNPVVWVEHDGHWRVSFAATPLGSLPNAQLVAAGGALLLFHAQEGTQLWRSTNGRNWRRVRIPDAMAAMPMRSVAATGNRVVATLANRYAGGPMTAYGQDDWVWTSADGGLRWSRDRVPDHPLWSTVDATAGGFLAAGTDHATGRWLVWSSTNGVSWSAVPAARSGSGLADLAGSAAMPYAGAGVAYVLSVDGGFLALNEQPDGRMLWSPGGRTWTRIWGPGPLWNSSWFPSGIGVIGDSPVLIERAGKHAGVPDGATTFWRLNPRAASAST